MAVHHHSLAQHFSNGLDSLDTCHWYDEYMTLVSKYAANRRMATDDHIGPCRL